MQIAVVLILLVLAISLFAREDPSVDITTLLLLATLVLTGVLTPKEAFVGFSSDIIIILGSIFIITGALRQTGVVDLVGVQLRRASFGSPTLLLLTLTCAVSFLAAFTKNTTATALFVAPAMSAARSLGMSPSKVLMPVAFASMLGGTCTLIGTSTNIAVSSYLPTVGMAPFGLFEFTPVGLMIVAVGITYLMTIGRWLLPNHPTDKLNEEAAVRAYLTEIVVMPGSQLVGQGVTESDVAKLGFQVLEVLRGKKRTAPSQSPAIAEGDILLVTGTPAELMKVKQTAGIEIRPDVKHAHEDLQSGNLKIAEVFINPRSDLIGGTLKTIGFRQNFGVTVLAVFRHGQTLREKLSQIRLRLGDMLLVQGTIQSVDQLRNRTELTLIEELDPSHYRRKRGLAVVLVFAAAIALGGLGIIPLPIAMMLGAVATVLVGGIRTEEAYRFVDWRLLVLIGGMTAFGTAMSKTGAAGFLAGYVTILASPFGTIGVMAGIFLLTVLLTQPMSNAAAALVVLPVALEAAKDLGSNPRTFAVTVMLAASVSFLTPFEPACLLVYGPGKYRFRDFVKVGAGLTIVLAVVVLWMIPRLWPLGVGGMPF